MPTVWPDSSMVRVHAHLRESWVRVRVWSWGRGVNDTREEKAYDQTGTRTQDLSQTGRILLPLSHRTNGRSSILQYTRQGLGNSYTMGCPPVRGDNPRALDVTSKVGGHACNILIMTSSY